MGASTNTAVIVLATQRSVFKFRFVDIDFMSVLPWFSFSKFSYLRLPPPPRRPPPPPPKPPPMLDAPRLLLARALEPLYPLEPPPKASRFPPPLRDRSRLPIRSAPPPLAPSPPPARLLRPPSPPRSLARLPPCRPTCCRALAWRFDIASPRVVPPNLSAVPRSP